tara:strand:- start:4888 stop:5082 length:195 start_codon:yes stop_codon:yes gene_type:complete
LFVSIEHIKITLSQIIILVLKLQRGTGILLTLYGYFYFVAYIGGAQATQLQFRIYENGLGFFYD